jgi:hypothetical protein
MTDAPTLFDTDDATTEQPVPEPGQRLAFTGDGKHWHGTVTRITTRPDGTPRIHVDVDPGNDGINAVAYRNGDHFRPTTKGERCPTCGKPDRGSVTIGRYV